MEPDEHQKPLDESPSAEPLSPTEDGSDSPQKAKEKPKSKKIKKPSAQENLVDALNRFAEVLKKDPIQRASERSAFLRLASTVGATGMSALQNLPQWLEIEGLGHPTSALLLELSLTDEAINSSRGDSVHWCKTQPDWYLYASLCSSCRVTAPSPLKEIAQSLKRRSLLRASHNPESANNPALRSDSEGLWLPPVAADSIGDVLELAVNDPYVNGPLYQELRARLDLLKLASLGRNASNAQLRSFDTGVSTLQHILRTQARLLDADGPDADQVWRMLLRVMEAVGRNPQMWNIVNAERDKLIAAPSNPSVVASTRWAAAVAASWCRTDHSMELIAFAPTHRLIALIRSARDNRAPSLLEAARKSLESTSASRVDDDEFWTALGMAAVESPLDRSWIEPLFLARQQEQNRDPTVVAAQSWPDERLLEDGFADLVDQGNPQTSIVAISIASERLLATAAAARTKGLESIASQTRAKLLKLDAVMPQLSEAIGMIPLAIELQFQQTRATLIEVVAAIRDLDPSLSSGGPTPSSQTSVEVSSLADGLRDLEFDPARRESQTAALRRTVKSRLETEASEQPAEVEALLLAIDQFPPEAAGLIWEVGIRERNALLLGSVERMITDQAWARRSLLDLLLRYAGKDLRPVPLDPSVARSMIAPMMKVLEDGAKQRGGAIVAAERHAAAGEAAIAGFLDEVEALRTAILAAVEPLSVRS